MTPLKETERNFLSIKLHSSTAAVCDQVIFVVTGELVKVNNLHLAVFLSDLSEVQ
jgi:hypothetical protein